MTDVQALLSYRPQSEPDLFSVGNVDANNNLNASSSRGPVTYGGVSYLKPDLVAPGVSIKSSTYDGFYGTKTGTSMSAPHVAGAVALLWSAFPALRGNVAETEQVLRSTATPIPAVNGEICPSQNNPSVPNNAYGYGLLNVAAAVPTAFTSLPPVSRLLTPCKPII